MPKAGELDLRVSVVGIFCAALLSVAAIFHGSDQIDVQNAETEEARGDGIERGDSYRQESDSSQIPLHILLRISPYTPFRTDLEYIDLMPPAISEQA
jgi:hypothetical protein